MNANHPPGCALALFWIGWFTFPFWAPVLGHFSNRLWTLQEASFGSYGWVPVVAVLWVAPLLVWTPLAQWNLSFSEHPWRLRAAWALMAGMAGFLGTGMLRTFGNCAFDRSPAERVTVIQVQSRKHVRFRIVDGPHTGTTFGTTAEVWGVARMWDHKPRVALVHRGRLGLLWCTLEE